MLSFLASQRFPGAVAILVAIIGSSKAARPMGDGIKAEAKNYVDRLEVHVTTAKGADLENATVTVETDTGKTLRPELTNNKGIAVFEGMNPEFGRVTVTATKRGLGGDGLDLQWELPKGELTLSPREGQEGRRVCCCTCCAEPEPCGCASCGDQASCGTCCEQKQCASASHGCRPKFRRRSCR